MANYIEHARSNYFRVKNLEAFEEATAPYGGFSIKHGETDDSLIMIEADESFPTFGYDEESGEPLPKEFSDVVAEHLLPDEVFIAMGSGHEKLRYITGWAYAMDCTGKYVAINLETIYDKARRKFKGKKLTEVKF